jgi:hypothetical protein
MRRNARLAVAGITSAALVVPLGLANEKAPGKYDFGAMVRLVMDSAIATSKVPVAAPVPRPQVPSTP